MKKYFLLLIVLCGLTAQAQYNKWAVSAELGNHYVADESALITDAWNHYGADVRYSLSDRFAIGITGGYDNLTLKDFDGYVSETNYTRLNLEATVELFDILNIKSKRFNLLGHGGPGISFIRNDRYNEDVFNMSGGITGLVKLSRYFAVKLDYTGTVNINQAQTLDGWTAITNVGINSHVTNASLGLVWYPGRKGKTIEHADWYVIEPVIPVITNVTNNYITREYIRQVEENSCECEVLEYVFFEHDKDKIEQSELNAIAKIQNYLANNSNAKVFIKGYASATKSSSEYNRELSHRRGMRVYDKLEAMGTNMNQVAIRAFGKDLNWKDEDIHDMARRVELVITKQ